MKHFLTALFYFLLVQHAGAQMVNDAPYLKDKKLPPFALQTILGKEITNQQIPSQYKYTCIIIFSPDCSHCEQEAADITKNADKFKNVYFVWASYREMEGIKKFAVKFGLDKQANVMIGRDPSFALPSFFRPRMTPFIAMYKNGSLLKVYEQGAKVTELTSIIESN